MSLHADQIVHLPASPLRAAARWALHQLKIYTLAAVGGGAIFMVWLGAYLFFSSSPHETQIQKPVSAPLPQTSAPTAPLISSLPANLLVGTPVFDARQMFIGRVENISHQMDDKTFDVVIKLHSDTLAQQFLAVPMSSVRIVYIDFGGIEPAATTGKKNLRPARVLITYSMADIDKAIANVQKLNQYIDSSGRHISVMPASLGGD